MTDQERHRLCDALRNTHPSRIMCKEAADEIERLADELQYQYACDKAQQREIERLTALAQSDAAEPVAWRYKPTPTSQEWAVTMQREPECKSWGWVVEPLYTASPRPDASAEIAELQERCADAQWLACEWMARHDKVVGFISKNYPSVMMPNLPFPSPVSRPDASAGLIEAAEMAEQCANGSFSKNEAMYLRGFADRLRARAADRSGK